MSHGIHPLLMSFCFDLPGNWYTEAYHEHHHDNLYFVRFFCRKLFLDYYFSSFFCIRLKLKGKAKENSSSNIVATMREQKKEKVSIWK